MYLQFHNKHELKYSVKAENGISFPVLALSAPQQIYIYFL